MCERFPTLLGEYKKNVTFVRIGSFKVLFSEICVLL